jgi:hypothetical protein
VWRMKLSFHQVFIHPNGLRSSELCPFYSGAAICPKLISDCTSLKLLIFNFFFLEHVWPDPPNWWKRRRPFLRFGDGDAWVCNSFGYASLLLIYI